VKKILILGGTGKLGKLLVYYFLQQKYKVKVLIRDPRKLDLTNENLEVLVGEVTNKEDLEKALNNIEVVISVLGHGFRTKYMVQENTLKNLIPLMKKKKINRFITVTGAALKTNKDKNSIILFLTEFIFNLIDPYRMKDARIQLEILEKSNLNWTVVRTPIHNNGVGKKIKSSYSQPMPWKQISRNSIAEFINSCIKEHTWIKESPVIY
jgi:putative NADH-flavin reductase